MPDTPATGSSTPVWPSDAAQAAGWLASAMERDHPGWLFRQQAAADDCGQRGIAAAIRLLARNVDTLHHAAKDPRNEARPS